MPKRLTDEEKIERYNERIRLQMIQNKKWVENNKQKYQELMASYSRNYYQKNKEELNRKRTEYNRKKKELASKVELVVEGIPTPNSSGSKATYRVSSEEASVPSSPLPNSSGHLR